MSRAAAVRIENRPNNTMEPMRMRLRPKESARRPPSSAPASKPRVLALKNVPSCSGVGRNSETMPPAATPAACRSKPSQKATPMQHAMIAVVLQ
jgi:hypothetical protein